MTRNKNLKVEIIDEITRKPFPEWGRQTLGKNTTVSSFIQADTDRPFFINIEAKIPFPLSAFKHRVIGYDRSWDLSKYPEDHWDYAPWHLLATLRFDGRIEKESIVYLSTAHPHFNHSVIMDGRIIPDSKGEGHLHRWVFKEAGVGIDGLLEKMSLASSGKEMNQEEQLASLVQGLDASCTDKEDSNNKAGMLEIVFERIHPSQNQYWEEWKPSMNNTEEGTDSKAPKNISHEATADKASRAKVFKWRNYVHYDVIPGGPYAIFQFKYRSEDVLRKYGFPGFPKKDTVVVPAELMEKVKLEEKGNKRTMGEAGGKENDSEEDATRTKRATTDDNKAGKDGRLAKFEGLGSGDDSDEEDMVTENRAEMATNALAALKGVPALQKDDSNSSSKGNNCAADATDDSFKHLDTGKDTRLPALDAIRSDWYDGDAEDSDDDDDEVKVDKKRQKMPSIFKKEVKEADEDDEVL